MADLTDREFARVMDPPGGGPTPRERGRNYVRHCEQLDRGLRGGEVECGGCALCDSRLPREERP